MSAPDTSTAAVERLLSFMRETAQYFARRPINGEDAAFWANAANADNAMRCEAALAALAAERDALRAALEIERTPKCEGCGAKVTEDCTRHPERACFREFHGGTRAALTPNPESR